MSISLYHLKDRNTSFLFFPYLNRTAVVSNVQNVLRLILAHKIIHFRRHGWRLLYYYTFKTFRPNGAKTYKRNRLLGLFHGLTALEAGKRIGVKSASQEEAPLWEWK
jgi:hypothetical protein